jgi:hypothetical protein
VAAAETAATETAAGGGVGADSGRGGNRCNGGGRNAKGGGMIKCLAGNVAVLDVVNSWF